MILDIMSLQILWIKKYRISNFHKIKSVGLYQADFFYLQQNKIRTKSFSIVLLLIKFVLLQVKTLRSIFLIIIFFFAIGPVEAFESMENECKTEIAVQHLAKGRHADTTPAQLHSVVYCTKSKNSGERIRPNNPPAINISLHLLHCCLLH